MESIAEIAHPAPEMHEWSFMREKVLPLTWEQLLWLIGGVKASGEDLRKKSF